MVEGVVVSIVTFFEGVSYESSVGVHCLVMLCHGRLVDNLVCLTVLCFKGGMGQGCSCNQGFHLAGSLAGFLHF